MPVRLGGIYRHTCHAYVGLAGCKILWLVWQRACTLLSRCRIVPSHCAVTLCLHIVRHRLLTLCCKVGVCCHTDHPANMQYCCCGPEVYAWHVSQQHIDRAGACWQGKITLSFMSSANQCSSIDPRGLVCQQAVELEVLQPRGRNAVWCCQQC